MTEPAAHDRRLVFLFGHSVATKRAPSYRRNAFGDNYLPFDPRSPLFHATRAAAWQLGLDDPVSKLHGDLYFPLLPGIFTLGYFVVQVCRDLDCLVH